jgi:hypothetical protein
MRAKKITSKKLIGDFVTLKQLLQSLPLSERTIRNYIDAGKMRAYKLDGMLVFNVLDVEAFLKRRAVGGGMTAPIIGEAAAETRVLSDDQAKAVFDKLVAEVDAKIASLTPEELAELEAEGDRLKRSLLAPSK